MDAPAPDPRGAFQGEPVTIDSPLGPLELGIVDATYPGVSAAVSRLLNRSIGDARATLGGHLPDWLVEDIRRNYISPEKVETLWAPTGHRFVVVFEREIVGTVHVARAHDTIFTIDRVLINVSARDYPGFKPERHHHVVNLSVKHELRRARLAMRMMDGIVTRFRDRFDGDGLWVRGDPPWHEGLVGLGYEHDPSMDIFLPADAQRTADLSHAEFNQRYACTCRTARPANPKALAARAQRMREQKLQYVSFTRAFERGGMGRWIVPRPPAEVPSPLTDTDRDDASLTACATDWGLVHRARPLGVARPASAEEAAALLDRASVHGVPVTVRGCGHSVAGESLAGGGIVLSTEKLRGIVAVTPERVTVRCGTTWRELVRALAPQHRLPPVIPGWLPATVGGTLAAGGFSKGSHRHGLLIDHVLELGMVTGDGRRIACSSMQAAWLFESALGGGGQLGVVAEATLPLVAHPPEIHVFSADLGDDAAQLAQTLAAAADDVASYHVTSFYAPGRGWGVVQALASEQARPAAAHATRRGVVPLLRYVDPERPAAPDAPASWLHFFAPHDALAALLSVLRTCLSFAQGDALQVIPVRKLRERPASFLALPDVAVGSLVHGVCVTRTHGGRDAAWLAQDTRALLDLARAAGATPYLVPADARAAWRARRVQDSVPLARALRLADPARILEHAAT